MTGDLEKQSAVLGRNAVWERKARLSSLPKYLAIQLMRFYWKATPDNPDRSGIKCKMLRPIIFPADNFDVIEMCNPAITKHLREVRDARRVAEDRAKRPRLEGPPEAEAVATATAAPAPAPAPAPASGVMDTSDDDALAAALHMSMEGAAVPPAAAAAGAGAGAGGDAAMSAASPAASSAAVD
ncbi:hypothetical protein EON62_03830, partial [archaeon]